MGEPLVALAADGLREANVSWSAKEGLPTPVPREATRIQDLEPPGVTPIACPRALQVYGEPEPSVFGLPSPTAGPADQHLRYGRIGFAGPIRPHRRLT